MIREREAEQFILSRHPILYLPFWRKQAINGGVFLSDDAYHHRCTLNGNGVFQFLGASPDTGGTQGVTVNGGLTYVNTSTWIKAFDSDWNVVASNLTVPDSIGVNHMGDGDYYNGKLYYPCMNFPAVDTQKISIFNATTLAYESSIDISAEDFDCTGLTIDAANDIIYIPSFNDGTKFWRYRLSDGAYLGTTNFSSALNNIQGISYHPQDGYLYINVDSTDSVYKVATDGTVGHGVIWGTHEAEGIDYKGLYLNTITNESGVCRVRKYAQTTWTPTGFQFEGRNSAGSQTTYLEIPFTSVLAPTSQISMGAWVYRDYDYGLSGRNGGTPANGGTWAAYNEGKRPFISKLSSGGYGLDINDGTSKMQVVIRRNAAYAIVGIERALVTPGWHFAFGTYDGRYTRFYLDGEHIAVNDAGANYPIAYADSNSLIIGADAAAAAIPDTNTGFAGKIGAAVMFDKAFGAVDVQTLCQLTKGRYR